MLMLIHFIYFFIILVPSSFIHSILLKTLLSDLKVTRLSTRPTARESELLDFNAALEGSVWRNEFQDLLHLNMPRGVTAGKYE
jgi:hypothetical protein